MATLIISPYQKVITPLINSRLFAEKYLQKGLKILVSGRIQTGSYVNQEGNKVYATNVIVEEHYFAEGKKLSGAEKKEDTDPDGFMHLLDGEELPFE